MPKTLKIVKRVKKHPKFKAGKKLLKKGIKGYNQSVKSGGSMAPIHKMIKEQYKKHIPKYHRDNISLAAKTAKQLKRG